MLERLWKKPLWKTLWRFLKKLGIKLPYDPAIPLLGTYPEKIKTHVSQRFLQLYIQEPGHGSDLNVHLQMNG